MNRFFLTHIVPRDKIIEYKLSVAAHNFCYNLIENNVFNKVFSILPTSVNQLNGKLSYPKDTVLIWSNLRGKNIFKYIGLISENLKILKKIPKGSNIWFYNCTILNIILILLLKIFKPSVKQFLILLDYTPNRAFDKYLSLPIINHMDGIIRLAEYSKFKNSNSRCIPGVTPINIPITPTVKKSEKKFLLSGVLDDQISMLPEVIKAFQGLKHFQLHITGRAKNESRIKSLVKGISNIHYHGVVSDEEYRSILQECPFMLSTRNPSFPENQCNFPSKIIEGLLYNRIIVSTIHYNQLEPIKIIEIPANNIFSGLAQIDRMSEDALLGFANKQQTVANLFNANVWIEKMSEIERNARCER